jgi:hypothetical protein
MRLSPISLVIVMNIELCRTIAHKSDRVQSHPFPIRTELGA